MAFQGVQRGFSCWAIMTYKSHADSVVYEMHTVIIQIRLPLGHTWMCIYFK